MDTEREKLSGTVENIIYKNESNDYTVFELVDSESNLITAVGNVPALFEGESVVLTGTYVFHKEFGRQFSFDSFEKFLPKEIEGIIQYLSSGTVKGIGPVTALKIVNKFGTDTFDVIENHPEWLSDIQGITPKKAAAISESFSLQSGMRSIMMLCGNHFTANEISRAYKTFGSDAARTIRDDPYVLCEGDDPLSFDKVDEFAKTFNFPLNHERRIISGIIYVLNTNAVLNGHTCLPIDMLSNEAAETLSLEQAFVYAMIEKFIGENKLSTYRVDDVEYVMTPEVSDAEFFIAKRICELDRQVRRLSVSEVSYLLENIETRFGINYADLQKQAIYEALSSGAMVLTGGPGTGKTTVVKALISIFDSLGMKYALAAPTGRAAKRLSEATSHEAKTLHRLLEVERTGGKKTRFMRNTRCPLDEEVVIVDEASMLDLSVAEALFRAMRRFSRIILIGDTNQLPSVGAGNVLADIIASGAIREVALKEIFRQSGESAIIVNAHKINSGEKPILNVTDNDFFFVRREKETDIPETIASLILERLPRTYGSDIRKEIQVIAPSKKGNAGVERLNTELQAKINPPSKGKSEKTSHGRIFREGDRVMQTVNNYEVEWEKGNTVGSGLFNGEVGVIESINHTKEFMKIRFDDKTIEYDFDNLDDLDLSYAITVHKSQGSEYPVVIIPMYSCSPMLMTRNLFYTAVTRARKMVILVGRPDIPMRMVENDFKIHRYTTLKNKISEYK